MPAAPSRCSARAIRCSTAPTCTCMCGSRARYPTEVVAGVTGMSGCWSAAGTPIAQGDDVLTVLPGTLPRGRARAPPRRHRRRRDHEARPQPAQGAARARPQRTARARDLCRARHHGRRGTMPLAAKTDDDAPYFAVVLVPGWDGTAVSGRLAVVGLGPGRCALAHAGGGSGARRRRCALRLRPLSRPRACARRPDPPSPPTTARKARAPPRRLRHAAEGAQRRRGLGRRSRRVRHGGGGVRGDRSGTASLARARCRDRARRHRDARGRRARRRAARPRFLRASRCRTISSPGS